LIAEITPDWYDAEGRKVFRPDSRRKSGFKPTFPIGRFVSQPLQYWCADMADVRKQLAKFNYVSDKEQFGREDYWVPPEEFEVTKKGDCEDFALWCWRQLLHLNYAARFVTGTSGRYGIGHAWVTFEHEGKSYLLEPQCWPLGLKLPRLSIVRYEPKFSVAWDGEKLTYFEHQHRNFSTSPQRIALLFTEWLFFWGSFWLTDAPKLFARALARKLRKNRPTPASSEFRTNPKK
jgi:hypothetical protein